MKYQGTVSPGHPRQTVGDHRVVLGGADPAGARTVPVTVNVTFLLLGAFHSRIREFLNNSLPVSTMMERKVLSSLVLWQKMTFDGIRSLMEDDLWWKTTFVGRRPLTENDLWWKTTNKEDLDIAGRHTALDIFCFAVFLFCNTNAILVSFYNFYSLLI